MMFTTDQDLLERRVRRARRRYAKRAGRQGDSVAFYLEKCEIGCDQRPDTIRRGDPKAVSGCSSTGYEELDPVRRGYSENQSKTTELMVRHEGQLYTIGRGYSDALDVAIENKVTEDGTTLCVNLKINRRGYSLPIDVAIEGSN